MLLEVFNCSSPQIVKTAKWRLKATLYSEKFKQILGLFSTFNICINKILLKCWIKEKGEFICEKKQKNEMKKNKAHLHVLLHQHTHTRYSLLPLFSSCLKWKVFNLQKTSQKSKSNPKIVSKFRLQKHKSKGGNIL